VLAHREAADPEHNVDDLDLDEDLPKFGPGRPEKIIDYAVIEGAAGIGCSSEE
jgi:hypothetical protein